MNYRQLPSRHHDRTLDGFFLAVLPKYRPACIGMVNSFYLASVKFWVSPAHLDPTVRTDSSVSYYRHVGMFRLGQRAFFQSFPLETILCRALVLDLNPRSLSAWLLLVMRFILRRRTVVWGHINPQGGSSSRTAPLRRLMRRLAQGTITYAYRDGQRAIEDLQHSKVWVAPNALYLEDVIHPCDSGIRQDIIYVGRFEYAKKVTLLIEGFALARVSIPESHLVLVGGGSQEDQLRVHVSELGLDVRVTFEGWIDDPISLSRLYSGAFVSVSPGFAGLGLTQSLGFGVPQIIARSEQHSPEIELADEVSSLWFDSDSPDSLAAAILEAWTHRSSVPLCGVSKKVRRTYSAEAMANGLISALTDGNPFHPGGEDAHV